LKGNKMAKMNVGKLAIVGVGNNIDTEDWMWCLHCEKIFQAKEMKADGSGGTQACPHCEAWGIGLDVYDWDSWCKKDPCGDFSHWPKNTDGFKSGQKIPLHLND
jgi:hypothetical protein